MRRHTDTRRTARRTRLHRRLIAAGVCLSLFFIWLDRQLNPIITSIAADQCRMVATLAINRAVKRTLEADPNLYHELYRFHYAQDGSINALWADAAAVNHAKIALTSAVSEELEALRHQTLSIPLGTLLGWKMFTGYGPEFNMHAVPSGFVDTDFSTRLQAQGINQTMLLSFITFRVEISTILPGCSSTEVVESELCIGQMLVIGEVPQMYAALAGTAPGAIPTI